jgi:hypothetical protein
MPRMLSRTGATTLLAALVVTASPALAQTPPGANPPGASPANPTVPVAPPSAPAAPAEKIVPPEGSPSNRLSQQGGVISPPNVDPGMTVNPPKNGSTTTPVIPPPGSPGGNPSVIPK